MLTQEKGVESKQISPQRRPGGNFLKVLLCASIATRVLNACVTAETTGGQGSEATDGTQIGGMDGGFGDNKGACIVLSEISPNQFPLYADPEVGKGYAKLNKGEGFTTISEIVDACVASDYEPLEQAFCSYNPNKGKQFQRIVTMYDGSDELLGGTCNFGCSFVMCPELP
jgi:hypothetical protein